MTAPNNALDRKLACAGNPPNVASKQYKVVVVRSKREKKAHWDLPSVHGGEDGGLLCNGEHSCRDDLIHPLAGG